MNAVAAPAAVMLPAPRRAVDDTEAVAVLPALFVPEASQWLSTSSGRIAGEGYSWMQAVHWVAESGLYNPRQHRSHGPRSFGPTTVRVAQELAELFPCRPGIEYLVRRTGLSERSVEYHLGMLREAGLLAYIVRGTRVRGERALASEFARMVPLEFDVALGIRTVLRDEAAPAYTRAVTGIAETGWELMARLGKKASRKLRRPRLKMSPKALLADARAGADGGAGTAVSAGSRCTPMGGSADGSSSAGTTSLPPETRLASGADKSSNSEKSKGKAGGRKSGRWPSNDVGRRYQLGRELTQQVEWLRGCSVPRISWVARAVADAGWSATEVLAWLHLRGTAQTVYRGSGLLAVLLSTAETVLDTPAKRVDAITQWRSAQEAQRRRRIEKVRADRERYDGDWQLPQSRAVHSEMDSAIAQLKSTSRAVLQRLLDDGEGSGATSYELDVQELAGIRAAAQAGLETGDTTLINDTVHGCGLGEAVRVYGKDLIRRAHQLDRVRRSSLSTYAYGA